MVDGDEVAEMALKAAKRYSSRFERSLGGPALSLKEVEALGSSRSYLVDCRSDEERKISMVKGAISKEAFEATALEPANTQVAVYCTIGYRSGQYATALVKKGWKKVYNCKGIVPFSHEGVELVDGKGESTRRIHVYGSAWDLANPDYETVTFSLWHQITTFLFS